MTFTFLHDLEDPRLEIYRNLKRSNLTRWSRQFVAEGQKVVERLLKSELPVESVLVRQGKLSVIEDWPTHDLPVYVIPDELSQELLGYNFHAGFLACGRRPENPDLVQLVSQSPSSGLILACPFLTNPENLGSIIRIATGFGVDGLLLGSRTCDPYSRRTIRVSMGNAFQLPIRTSSTIDADMQQLREEWGYELWASTLDENAVPLSSLVCPQRCVLMLGNEDTGLDADSLRIADRHVVVPMCPGTDSLNVALAAGIFVHHLVSHSEEISAPKSH